MPFNAMIADSGTAIDTVTPLNNFFNMRRQQAADKSAMEDRRQKNIVNQMTIDKGQRDQADQAAYRKMLADPNFNASAPGMAAKIVGMGGAADLPALTAPAKAAQELAQKNFIANSPRNASGPAYQAYLESGLNDPIMGPILSAGVGGADGARQALAQQISTPEGLEAVRRLAAGQTQQDVAELEKTTAMTNYYDARAAAAARPDAADAVKPLAINKMTIRDPNNPDRSIIVNANVPPNDPNYVLGEAPQSASALAAQTKKEAADETKRVAQSQVDSLLDSLSQDANNLYKQGGIPSIKDPPMSNIGKWAKNTTVGLGISKAIGTEAQSTLEKMKSTKLQLLNAIKAATGMSSKTLDSNQELKTWLDSLGTTGGTLESLNEIIKGLRSYGEGAGTTPSPAGAAPPDGAGPATGGNKTFRFDAQGNPIP